MNAVASAHTHQPRGLIVWLSLAQLVTWGSTFYTFALLMEPIERELGFTRAQSSLGFSIALLTEGLFALTVGRWIDAGHERRVMTGGSLLVGVTLLAHSAVQSLTGFYAVWALLGAGMAATLYAPVFAVVTRRFPQDFRRAIITMTFLGGLASTVFIPLWPGWSRSLAGGRPCGCSPRCSLRCARRCMRTGCATHPPASRPARTTRPRPHRPRSTCAARRSC